MREDWVPKFLEALADEPNVSGACRAADISRTQAYATRDADPEFAKAWQDALDDGTDDLIGEMHRRARHGCERPVYYKGKECGRVVEYSDTLAIFLAKAHRPEVYRETVKQEHSGSIALEVDAAAREVATREIESWRRQMTESLSQSNTPSASLTAPTSSTPMG